MKLKLLVLLAAMGTAASAMAANNCYFIPDTPPEELHSASLVIHLNADAPESTDVPIGQSVSSPSVQSKQIVCTGTTELWGSRDITSGLLVPYPGKAGFYKTNINGIGVRFYAAAPGSLNGAKLLPQASEKIPSNPVEGGNAVVGIIGSSRFLAEFYKLEKTIDLSSATYQNSVNVMTPQSVGDSKVGDSGTIKGMAYLSYFLGNIDLVSVPVCTVDQPQKVDFGIVSADNVKTGVTKKFQFGMLCQTDYGKYNTVASINATKKTADGKYIVVDDAKGDSDSLIIEITDSNNQTINVDGSTERDVLNVASGDKANYEWKAILKQKDGSPAPAKGQFNASAIITLDIK